MTSEQKALLAKCLELTRELAANEPPEWELWHRREWEEQMCHGPRYYISAWFGPCRERERMRYRRALDALEEQGLVELHRAWGRRLSHVALTDAGERLAVQILDRTDRPTDDA